MLRGCGLRRPKPVCRKIPGLKARYLQEWLRKQRMFDVSNDLVGSRYKARLESRSYGEGASREGRPWKRGGEIKASGRNFRID